MLDSEETIVRFGYDPARLKRYSEKKVVLMCDYCGTQTYPTYASFVASGMLLTCGSRSCRKLRREATCLARYGTNNYLSTPDAKEKRRLTTLERYGVEHTSMLQEVRDKMADARRRWHANKEDL